MLSGSEANGVTVSTASYLLPGETGGYKVVIRFPTIPNTVFIFKNYNCRPQDLFLWTHQPKIRKRMKGFWLMKPLPHHSLVSAVPCGGQWVPAAMHIAEIRVRWAGKVSTMFHKTPFLHIVEGFVEKYPNFNVWMSVYNNSSTTDFYESITRHFQQGESSLVCLRHLWICVPKKVDTFTKQRRGRGPPLSWLCTTLLIFTLAAENLRELLPGPHGIRTQLYLLHIY